MERKIIIKRNKKKIVVGGGGGGGGVPLGSFLSWLSFSSSSSKVLKIESFACFFWFNVFLFFDAFVCTVSFFDFACVIVSLAVEVSRLGVQSLKPTRLAPQITSFHPASKLLCTRLIDYK
jgi:hypothetical protein